MSLSLKGDLTSTTGEYLPAPYIDQIVVEGENTLRFKYSVFLQEKIDQHVNTADGIVTAAEAYQSTLMKNIYVYTIELWNMADTGFYKDIINGKINPLALIALSGSDYIDASRHLPSSLGRLEWNEGMPDYSVETVYDEDGNPVSKYFTELSKNLTNAPYPNDDGGLYPNGWAEVDSFQAIAFTSTINIDDLLGKTEAEINIPLLNVQTSDISYIKVFENGQLMDRYEAAYVDNNGIIYNDTPLIAIDSLVYKPDKTTHEQIVANFQDLLNQYSGEYKKEKGNVKFKRMIDKISFILEVYGEETDLLVQLDTLRRAFPDKTPAKLIGKFYKRFRKRISSVNKVIKKGPPLTRKIIYNAKIVDLRAVSPGSVKAPTYDDAPEANGAEYIYQDWGMSTMQLEDIAPGGDDGVTAGYDVVTGHFFFDYEKALRRTSNIATVLDVNKLEKWGLHIPYSNFQVTEAYVERSGFDWGDIEIADDVMSVGYYTPTGEDLEIGCAFLKDEGKGKITYPITDYAFIRGPGTAADYVLIDPSTDLESGNFIQDWHLEYFDADGNPVADSGDDWDYFATTLYYFGWHATPYGPPPTNVSYDWTTAPDTWSGTSTGLLTSLVLRHYVNPSNITSTIDNYRLMCFELLDYRIDSTAIDYQVRVLVTDNTQKIVDDLAKLCGEAYTLLEEYDSHADHLCSFNEDIGVFNEFFSEAMLVEYPDSTTAPWTAAPATYLLHIDLIYNTYGGDLDQIKEAAQQLSDQINPVTGTKPALKEFKTIFADFINDVYSIPNSIVGAAAAALEPDREIIFSSILGINVGDMGHGSAYSVMGVAMPCDEDSDCDAGYKCDLVDTATYMCKSDADLINEAAEEAEALKCYNMFAESEPTIYAYYIEDIEDAYNSDPNILWAEAVDSINTNTALEGALDGCTPSDAEYDLDPHPGGLCSENEGYNNRLTYLIDRCTDLSQFPGSRDWDSYWDKVAAGTDPTDGPCKVDEAAKRNISCFDCKNAPDQAPCVLEDLGGLDVG